MAGAAILALALARGRWVARRARLRRLVLESLNGWGDWTRGSRIREQFGPGIYPTLRDLAHLGLIDRREGPSTVEELARRGSRPVVWYRLTELGAERLARTPVCSTSRKGAE